MPRAKPPKVFKCPGCGDVQSQPHASSVAHRCPVRMRQATPPKGKKKLPEWTDYDLIEQAPQPISIEPIKAPARKKRKAA